MKNDDLDKLIDQSLTRLDAKAAVDREKALAMAPILPSLKTVLIIVVVTCIAFGLSGGLFLNGIKTPLFNLGFWSYPLLLLFLMTLLVGNYEKMNLDVSILVITIYIIFFVLTFPLYEKFLNFMIDSGYNMVVPFVNYIIEI